MRITAFRTWVAATVNQGIASARKTAKAITKRLRPSSAEVDAGVGVGDDESSFGGGRNRVWFEWVEDTKEKLRELFEKSVFERFPRVQKFLLRFVGSNEPEKPPITLAPKPQPRKLGAHTPERGHADLYAQVERARFEAHVREGARRGKDDDES